MLRRNTSCGCSGKFCGIFLYRSTKSPSNGWIHELPFSTLAMRNRGKRVSVPWQMRLVIMSATSRWPSTIHRNALCAMKFWVCGGSHFAT